MSEPSEIALKYARRIVPNAVGTTSATPDYWIESAFKRIESETRDVARVIDEAIQESRAGETK